MFKFYYLMTNDPPLLKPISSLSKKHKITPAAPVMERRAGLIFISCNHLFLRTHWLIIQTFLEVFTFLKKIGDEINNQRRTAKSDYWYKCNTIATFFISLWWSVRGCWLFQTELWGNAVKTWQHWWRSRQMGRYNVHVHLTENVNFPQFLSHTLLFLPKTRNLLIT